MHKIAVLSVMTLTVVTSAITMAEPISLSAVQLDGVTAGAAVSTVVDANALAAGSVIAETVTGAVTGAASESLGNVDLGVGLGLAASNAAACCDGGVGVGTSAGGSGDNAFGGSQAVLLDTIGGSISHIAVTAGVIN